MIEPVYIETDDGFVLEADDGSWLAADDEIEVGSDYFQRMILRVVPPWLTRENGRRLLQSIGALYDKLADDTTASLELRFPSANQEDALPAIGRDRLIVRGPLESAESYAARLVDWLDAHRNRGGPYALLGQLHAYYVEQERQIDLVYANGARYILHPDGTVTHDLIVWRQDSDRTRWAQAWLVHHLDADPGSITAVERARYLQIPREWSAAHVLPIVVGLAWDGWSTLWDYPAATRTWDEFDARALTWDEHDARGVS